MSNQMFGTALPTYVDPHSHHQFSNFTTLKMLVEASYQAAACLSYVPVRPSSASTLRDLFMWLVEAEVERLRRAGLRPIIGVGVHPRNIPKTGRSDALAYVEEFLPEANVLGEVGIETGSEVEKEFFVKQLEIADRLDKPVVVHTPRVNKAPALKLALRLLAESRLPPERVLIDHLTPDLVGQVPRGHYVGLTVQPGKLSEDQVAETLKADEDRFLWMVVNSDCGREESDPLAVMKTAHHLASLGVDVDVVAALVRDNARRFLSL